MKIGLIEIAAENFDVTTAAINVLFVFHGKLNDQVLVIVIDFSIFEFRRKSIESGILRRLDTLIGISISKEFAGSPFEFAEFLARMLGLHPARSPIVG